MLLRILSFMCVYSFVKEKVGLMKRRGAVTGSLGVSLKGREIPFIIVGSGECVIITGAIHAREHATASLVLMQAERAFANRGRLNKTFCFVPCVNPDGMEIANGNISPPEFYSGDVRLYKANAEGVDLNVNFDAGWGAGKSNVFYPAGENYVGAYPFSEPETASLRDFTLKLNPAATVSYHAKGREIYYDFNLLPDLKKRARSIAEFMGARLGYKVVHGSGGSTGGYKDWCEEKLRIPAFTVEIGDDRLKHPVCEKDLTEDYTRNVDLPLWIQNVI